MSEAGAVPAAGVSLQEHFAPESTCFGCGPANAKGLRIRSFAEGDKVIAEWRAEPHHEAFPGVLNGGIVGALLDCHSNWTAAHHLMRAAGAERVPACVTADYHVKMRKPTPTDRPLRLEAQVVESGPDRATVEASISADGVVTATCRGTFIAVKPGHPAYGRW